VDALFRGAGVAVELDGHRNHRSPAQVKRDRRKDLALRSAGLIALRYSDEQLTEGSTDVLADLRRLL
jgi:very-short-patch-repair endonuclease